MKAKRTFIILSAIIFTAVLVSACSRPFSKAFIEPNESFKGLSDSPVTRLFMVHGMCHHTKEWFSASVATLKKTYKLQGGEIGDVSLDSSTGVALYAAELFNDKTSVKIYGLIYSGVGLKLKQEALCSNVSEVNDVCTAEVYGNHQTTITKYDKQQAKLNKVLKNELMNNCLADAVIYLGKTGEVIRAGVRHALIRALENSKEDKKYIDTPIFYYSESLGSKILADSIVCAKNDEEKYFEREMPFTTHFVMAANQITLLNLGNNRVPCKKDVVRKTKANPDRTVYNDLFEFIKTNKELYNKAKPPKSVTTPVTVLSYTDPNDVLSYQLSRADIGKARLINISVSNASTYLGVLEDPLAAHTTYEKNKSFIQLLWEGHAAISE